MNNFEKLGMFYLGREVDSDTYEVTDKLMMYDSSDLTTHAMCVGMTGSGKTGLCINLLEEAAMDRIPAIIVDPKGDMANLLLSFPELKPSDFEPWVAKEEAQKSGMSVSSYAADQASKWREGLADWGIDRERIKTLHETTDITIYTPGSTAGRPLSLLKSFDPPAAAILGDVELLAEQVSGTTDSILGLLGVDIDPLQSREHILITHILHHYWSRGQALDLASLITAIQKPPFAQVGIMDLEAFYPGKERFALALRFNNLLASPQFGSWLTGEPLNIDNLLHNGEGKPQLSILSIAHLGEAERMFFVSFLLNRLVSWMRTQPGTSSLRAIFYMDEIFGYFPPVAQPPSKKALLTLLKQARAYGLGIMLTTQNPVDLDYKGLANMGTWFIGRLVAERDKARLLDGLEGAATASGMSFRRKEMDMLLSGLKQRVFLMNNVHEDAPVLFQTRWAMSYLAGPMTRDKIRELSGEGVPQSVTQNVSRTGAQSVAVVAASPVPFPAAGADRSVSAASAFQVVGEAESVSGVFGTAVGGALGGVSGASDKIGHESYGRRAAAAAVVSGAGVDAEGLFSQAPGAPAGVEVYFPHGVENGSIMRPALFAMTAVHFADKKTGTTLEREENWVTAVEDAMVAVDWERRLEVELSEADFSARAPQGVRYYPLTQAAKKKTSYTAWQRNLKDVISREAEVEIFYHPETKLTSNLDETKRDFALRIEQQLREKRDLQVEKLRKKYMTKISRAEERVRKQEQRVEAEKEQATDAKTATAISIGATVLGAFLGRKAFSASTVSKAATAAKTGSRSRKQSGDVDRAKATLRAYQEDLADIEAEMQAEIDNLTEGFAGIQDSLQTLVMKPLKKNISVKGYALVWLPESYFV